MGTPREKKLNVAARQRWLAATMGAAERRRVAAFHAKYPKFFPLHLDVVTPSALPETARDGAEPK